MTDWTRLIRDTPDFPRPGVLFKDIMPMLADAAAFAAAIDALAAPWRDARVDAVLAIESRGFLLGAPMARALGTGLVPVRKPGGCLRARCPRITRSSTARIGWKSMPTRCHQGHGCCWWTTCSRPAARCEPRFRCCAGLRTASGQLPAARAWPAAQ